MTDNIDFSAMKTSDLLILFNEKARLLGLPEVKRFSDRKSAERRVNEIIAKIGSVPPVVEETAASTPEETTEIATNEQTAQNETKETDDMAKKNTKTKTGGAKARGKTKRTAGELVSTGSYRDKLLSAMKARKNRFTAIGDLLKSVYGNNYKEFRAPLMMVMKGLKKVLADNKTGLEVRKMRENKENHFGLFDRSHPKSA